MFRIAICDDEVNICSEVEQIILDYSNRCIEKLDVEVYYSGEEICKHLKRGEEFDLIFLDIELKKINGVDVGKFIRNELKNEMVFIVYISAKDNYYQKLFDVRPMHFLHKPLEKEKIILDIEKAIELSDKLEHTFLYKQAYTIHKKVVKNILYFEANGRKIKIVTTNGEDSFYGSLNTIYSELEKYHFFFIHQSYLVNYAHVIVFAHKEITMSNYEILPISRQKKASVLQMIMQLEKAGGIDGLN